MSILDSLEHILKETSRLNTGSGSLDLREKDRGAALQRVTVKGIDRDVLLIQNKARGSICQDLKDCDGIQRRCDYVLACADDDGLRLIFVELKSENPNLEHITTQFKGTECFLDYCDAVLKRFYGVGMPPDCRRHYVVFHKARPLEKTPTQFPHVQQASTAERPHLQFYEKPLRLRQLIALS